MPIYLQEDAAQLDFDRLKVLIQVRDSRVRARTSSDTLRTQDYGGAGKEISLKKNAPAIPDNFALRSPRAHFAHTPDSHKFSRKRGRNRNHQSPNTPCCQFDQPTLEGCRARNRFTRRSVQDLRRALSHLLTGISSRTSRMDPRLYHASRHAGASRLGWPLSATAHYRQLLPYSFQPFHPK